MLKKKIQDAINAQINAELYSAYLYLSMAAYFESVNLKGFANWMRVQDQEERFHAMKFYNYVIERGGKVLLTAIDSPETAWKSPLAAFTAAYEHELKVTAMINGLVDLAIKESDHATASFLQWYVNEQVEEEANVDGVVQQLKLGGDNSSALFMIDKELAARVYTPPAAAAQ